jgi:hypothetical protein
MKNNLDNTFGIQNSRYNLRRERLSVSLKVNELYNVRRRANGFTLGRLKERTLRDFAKLIKNVEKQDSLNKDPNRVSFLNKIAHHYLQKFTESELKIQSSLIVLVGEYFIIFKGIFEDLKFLKEALKVARLNKRMAFLKKLIKELKASRDKERAFPQRPITIDYIERFIKKLQSVLVFKEDLKW